MLYAMAIRFYGFYYCRDIRILKSLIYTTVTDNLDLCYYEIFK